MKREERRLKHLLLLVLMLLPVGSVWATAEQAYKVGEVPNVHLQDARQYVSDPSGILSTAARDTLNTICQQLDGQKGVEVAVVMLPSIEGGDIFTFAHELFRQWGIGQKKSNTGLLILFVGDLRQVRFTTGYGLEGTLTDALCKRIQTRYMVPRFRQGDYDGGMVMALKATASVLNGDSSLAKEGQEKIDGGGNDLLLMVFIVVLLFLCPYLFARYAQRSVQCPHCGQRKSKRIAVHRRVENGQPVVVSVYRCEHCHRQFERRNHDNNQSGRGSSGSRDAADAILWGSILGSMSGRRGGGFGSSGFGGGFGGSFGGGSTGGGGSSSGW